jgi:hypothetical protein
MELLVDFIGKSRRDGFALFAGMPSVLNFAGWQMGCNWKSYYIVDNMR